jgi:hypothetical protein
MKTKLLVCASSLLILYTVPALAQSLSVQDTFLQWYYGSPNNIGFSTGSYVRVGASSVIPNGFPIGSPGATTGTASTTNLSTGAPIVVPLNPEIITTPNFLNTLFPICTTGCSPSANNNPSNLTGTWTLSFSNATVNNSPVTDTLSLVGPGVIPIINSVSLSGTSALPTFSWTPPSGTTIDGYRIEIYQNDLVGPHNTGDVTFAQVSPSATSYTVKQSDFTGLYNGNMLLPGTNYTIGIATLEGPNISAGNNHDVSAISWAYSSFQTLPTGTVPVSLPSVTRVGNQVVNIFNVAVQPGITYAIDPEVATGYVYKTGSGNPNFESVSLPDIGNPDPYSVYIWNGSSFVFDTTLAGNTVLDFAPGGVSEFEVLGIDPGLGLDPTNPTAFITDLTFESAGSFTGTMTPITASVPELSSWAMMLIGFAGLGFAGYRASRKSASIAA